MKHSTLLIACTLLLAACTNTSEPSTDSSSSTSAVAPPTPCECVSTYKEGDADAKKGCDSLRVDTNFDTEFRKCLAASITGKSPDQVNFLKEGEMRMEIPNSGSYRLLAEKSTIAWVGKKVLYSHNGEIKLKEGSVSFDNGSIRACDLVVDMSSITNKDIEDEEERNKLLTHLRSEDFFDVANHPEARFSLSSSEVSSGKGKASGELTIKGVSKTSNVQNVIVARSGDKNVIITGIMLFDRTDFNVRFGSGKFFDNLGDNLIKDEVIINFKLRGTLIEEGV